MPIVEEAEKAPPALATSREPVAPKGVTGKSDSVGTIALNDAMILVLICWAIVFFLALSLRTHNI